MRSRSVTNWLGQRNHRTGSRFAIAIPAITSGLRPVGKPPVDPNAGGEHAEHQTRRSAGFRASSRFMEETGVKRGECEGRPEQKVAGSFVCSGRDETLERVPRRTVHGFRRFPYDTWIHPAIDFFVHFLRSVSSSDVGFLFVENISTGTKAMR